MTSPVKTHIEGLVPTIGHAIRLLVREWGQQIQVRKHATVEGAYTIEIVVGGQNKCRLLREKLEPIGWAFYYYAGENPRGSGASTSLVLIASED